MIVFIATGHVLIVGGTTVFIVFIVAGQFLCVPCTMWNVVRS
jgi:hypothetical protein